MKAGIAGAGIMGRLMALALNRAGWDVTLFDAENAANCSVAAAGLLTPVTELEKNDVVIFKLGMEALDQHWPDILERLQQKIYFQRTGSLVVSHPRDQADLLRYMEMIASKLSDKNEYQKISPAELEPDLAKFQSGYFFSNEGQVDNQGLLIALKSHLKENNVTWFDEIVTTVKPGKIISSGNTHTFDLVFDCRGLGAKDFFADLRSVRGELLWLHAPDVFITRPVRFLHPRYSLYIVPRPKQIYLLGASEIESEDFSDMSVQTTLELLTAAYYVNSNFSEARVIKTVTQCRPTLADHLPAIKFTEGLAAINGLYRHGYLIAPSLAVEVMRWVEGGVSARDYPNLWEQITPFKKV